MKDGEKTLHADIRNSAAMDGTCVYLMGLTHLKEIADTLMKEGKSEKHTGCCYKWRV